MAELKNENATLKGRNGELENETEKQKEEIILQKEENLALQKQIGDLIMQVKNSQAKNATAESDPLNHVQN